MADKTLWLKASDGTKLPVLYHDNGDGTYSPVSVLGTSSVAVTGTTTTKEVRSATGTVTSVSASASNGTILAANANRLGATIFNDADKTLYLKLGPSSSTSSFTAALSPKDTNGVGGYYEVPAGYTGIITGLWATGPTGNARVTELT